MKIWVDTTPKTRSLITDNDCTRAFSEQSPLTWPLADGETQHMYTRLLQQRKHLHIQACNDERWLVCDPTGSGQVAVLDTSAFGLLQQFHSAHAPLELVQADSTNSSSSIEEGSAYLYQLGFLQESLLAAPARRWQESQTLTAWLHMTNACNLRCSYCYLEKTNEHMPDDIAQRAIDAVFRSALQQHYQQVALKYAGGEASLRFAQVSELHDYALSQAKRYSLGLTAQILSNGVMLTQPMIDQLKARQIGVTLSLDGIGEAHDRQRVFRNGSGSFHAVDRSITRLLANGIVPTITVTVSQRNLDGLPALVAYILEREMPFSLNYYRDNDCSTNLQDLRFAEAQMIAAMRSVFTMIEQQLPRQSLLGSLIDKADLTGLHRRTCEVGQHALVIDQQGGVAKCQADIRRRVTTIDHVDPLQAVRDDRNGVQSMPVDEKQGCRDCEWRYWCAGGCPIQTYRFTGRYDVQSPNCHIYQALFPEVLRLEALRLLKYEEPIALGRAVR